VAQGRLRGGAQGRGLYLLPAAAFALHQLRYTLAYGSHAGSALTAQGHAYMTSLAPWLVLLLAFGAGSFVLRVACGRDDRPRRSPLGLWALASCVLLAIYTVQELLEGLFASGHPGGFEGVFGHGGWWAVPLALLLGAAIAALLHVGRLLIAAVRRRSVFGPAPLVAALQAVWLPLPPPLAGAAAGRAPPAA